MKKLMRKSVALMMMLVMILAATSTTFAATTKTVKKKSFTTTTSVINKNATRVKKGTTKLYVKGSEGYVKFVAPKTKTYYFTFSQCTSKERCNNGFVTVMQRDKTSPKYTFSTKVKTKGGRNTTLWLSVNGYKFTGDLLTRPIASRTATKKLKKGEAIYFYMYFGGYPVKTNLKIK